MADSGPADPSRSRRRSRFDDPTPSKRTGFQGQPNGAASAQPPPGGVHIGLTPPGGAFQGGPNPAPPYFNLQNGQFSPQPGPLTQPVPFGFFPNPQLLPQQPIPFAQHAPPGHPVFIPQFPAAQLPPPVCLPPPAGVDLAQLRDKEDLDSCHVGVMASALLRLKGRGALEPYRPIEDPADIPDREAQAPVQQVSLVQRNRVEDFYDELEEIFEQHRAEIDPADPKYDYSRRRKFNVGRVLSQPLRILTPDDIVSPAKRDFYAAELYGAGAKESAGLGSGEDLFESFRRKRSSKYHETYAIREAVRKDPNCIVVSPSEVCFKCNKPGHYAKDCKYGIF